MEKFYCPVEWLAYLAEEIFKPVGSVLNGEIDWYDYGSIGTIRVENSFVSVKSSFDVDKKNPAPSNCLAAAIRCPKEELIESSHRDYQRRELALALQRENRCRTWQGLAEKYVLLQVLWNCCRQLYFETRRAVAEHDQRRSTRLQSKNPRRDFGTFNYLTFRLFRILWFKY